MAAEVNIQTSPQQKKRRLFKVSLGLALLIIAGIAIGLGIYREYVEIITWNYSLADLLPDKPPGHEPTQNVFQYSADNSKAKDLFTTEIKQSIQPESWDDQGGRGTITPFYLSSSLIVKNNRAAHRKIAELLDRKRQDRKAIP